MMSREDVMPEQAPTGKSRGFWPYLTGSVLPYLREKGLAETARYARVRLAERIRAYLDRSFDRRYHTETTGAIELSALKVNSEHVSEGIWYEPIRVSIFRQLLGSLAIRHEEHIFIDFGSGKGRALLLGSEFPFSRVIGVEFSPELHAVALRNFQTYRNPRQRCFHMESVCMDAVYFPLPPEPSVLFFYSPFKPPVLAKVIAGVLRSLENHPRSVYVVFYGAIPGSIQLLKDSGLKCQEIKLRLGVMEPAVRRGLILTTTGTQFEIRTLGTAAE
jgi:hypothetical protein